jgi:ribosomal protein L35
MFRAGRKRVKIEIKGRLAHGHAIRNHRSLEKTILAMRNLSLKILQETAARPMAATKVPGKEQKQF